MNIADGNYSMAQLSIWNGASCANRSGLLIKAIPAHWGILTLIPCVFCVYLIFVASWPGSYLDNPVQMIYAYAAVVPLVVVYIAVFRSLLGQYRIQMERQNAALLTVQISALREKLHEMEEVEERIRVQRHDLRHQLQTAAELLVPGRPGIGAEFPGYSPEAAGRAQGDPLVPVAGAGCCIFLLFCPGTGSGGSGGGKDLPAGTAAGGRRRACHCDRQCPGECPPCQSGSAPESRRISCRMIGYPDLMLEIVNPFCTGGAV